MVSYYYMVDNTRSPTLYAIGFVSTATAMAGHIAARYARCCYVWHVTLPATIIYGTPHYDEDIGQLRECLSSNRLLAVPTWLLSRIPYGNAFTGATSVIMPRRGIYDGRSTFNVLTTVLGGSYRRLSLSGRHNSVIMAKSGFVDYEITATPRLLTPSQ